MKSYFFVPASRINKIQDIERYQPDSIIIDFEDAILAKNIDIYFNQLKDLSDASSYWYRIPLRNSFEDVLDFSYIEKFHEFGVKFIVLPKLKTVAELSKVCDRFPELRFIILIEHPRLLVEFGYVSINYPNILVSLKGLGIGSHDLMGLINAKHTDNQLDYPRKEVLYLAKAYDLIAIDIASMDIFNQEAFVEEAAYGSDNGYDGKFLIHPRQLSWLKDFNVNDTASLIWAKNVMKYLPENYDGEGIEPFILDGEVIEKPHALRALEIIKLHNYGK